MITKRCAGALLSVASIPALVVSLTMAATSAFGVETELEVSAGDAAEAVWIVPVKVQAGEAFTARLEIRDRYGNVVTDYGRRGRGFEILSTGRGELWPKAVAAKQFERGVAEIQLVYKIAERIELIARTATGPGPRLEAKSIPFYVSPGKLAELRVVSPASARAGVPFRVTIVALDASGNQVRDFADRTDGVILSTDGLGVLSPVRIPAIQFREGLAELTVTYSATGDIDLRVKDSRSAVAGKSAAKIKVGAGEPVKFLVTAPGRAIADESFDIAITAVDAFGNAVLDYDAIGTMVFLGADGSVLPRPSEIPAKKFAQGVAYVQVTYSQPENVALAVSEPGTTRGGQSGRIDIQSGGARAFEVIAPEAVEAGSPFTVKVRAIDARGNPAPRPPDGRIILSILGSVGTTPIELSSSAFKNGQIEHRVSYNVAEEILLSAQDGVGAVRSEPAKVTVRPGPVATVEAQVPYTASAGAGVPVNLLLLDAFRNPVSESPRWSGRILIRTEGPEVMSPVEVGPEAFVKGKATATIPYFRSGKVSVAADVFTGAGRPVRVSVGSLDVIPAPLHHFDVMAPGQAAAGKPFRIAVTARDAYGNPVIDYDRTGGGITIQSSGIADLQPSQVTPASFKTGVAQVELRTFATERITLTVSEKFGSVSGKSGQIQIIASPLSHFLVSASPKVRAGEMFPVRIEAQDMYYNIIKDFTIPGRIRLSASNQTRVVPADIDAGDFTDGVSIIQTTLTTAGTSELVVSSEDGRASGRSNAFRVMPSAASSYKAEVLDPVTAGEPFRVRVSALDAYGNPVDDPKAIGRPAKLEVLAPLADAQAVTPTTISPLLFSRGIAEAYLALPQAGRVTIQVKSGGVMFREMEVGEWRSQIEGLFFKSDVNQTELFLLANGPLEYRAAQPTQFQTGVNSLVITLPSATLLRPYDYEDLNLPGLKAAKLTAESGAAPRLVLKVDASYGYGVLVRSNLLQVTLRAGAPQGPVMLSTPAGDQIHQPSGPTLAEIQRMVDRGEYKEARRNIDVFLSAHPGHPEAAMIRARLDKVLRVLGQ